MLITFNKSGSLANIDFQYDSFSQGDNNVHIVNVIIDDESFNNLDYNGYVQFLREGETTPSPKLIMTPAAKGYTFKMNTDWYTAISGTLKMTIEIKQYDENGLQSNKAYGVVNIPVMESVSGISDVETTITNEEYLALVNLINEKADGNTNNTFAELQTFEKGIIVKNSSIEINSNIGTSVKLDSFGSIKKTNSDGTSFDVSVPNDNGTIALTKNIPTRVSELENDENFINKNTADNRYLGVNAKASSSMVADSVAWSNVTGKPENATTTTAGLMSAKDKENLDTIVDSFNSDDADSTIESVKEVLKVFEAYPAGTNLANALSEKEDKSKLKALAYKDSLSKSDVGLGNVNNTSDEYKPLSAYARQALEKKANITDVYSKSEADETFSKINPNPLFESVRIKNTTGQDLLYAQGFSVLSADENNRIIKFGYNGNKTRIISSEKPMWEKPDGTTEELATIADLTGEINPEFDTITIDSAVRKKADGTFINLISGDDTQVHLGDDNVNLVLKGKTKPTWVDLTQNVSWPLATMKDLYDSASFSIEVVETLPTSGISLTTIYLKKSATSGEKNIYEEYVYTSDGWELLGVTDGSPDLTNYYTKTEVDEKVAESEQSITDINAKIGEYETGSSGTAVPNSGYVSEIHFDTSLSVEEVVNIIESANLTYDTSLGINLYNILLYEDLDDNNNLQPELILALGTDNDVLNIVDITTGFVYFTNITQDGFIGWNPLFNGSIQINHDVLSVDGGGVSVGAENDKLTELVYVGGGGSTIAKDIKDLQSNVKEINSSIGDINAILDILNGEA